MLQPGKMARQCRRFSAELQKAEGVFFARQSATTCVSPQPPRELSLADNPVTDSAETAYEASIDDCPVDWAFWIHFPDNGR